MRIRALALVCFAIEACVGQSGANSDKQKSAAWHDPSPHRVQFINVDSNVKLEVLDWGGAGRPVVLLAGLQSTAHIFDEFASKLTAAYHVYGITRRGYGASSAPASGYSADRLGDDVLAVVGSLKLNRPVLVGASIGGEELSSVGSRHPEKIAGLIYLDAGYSYAYYDHARGDLNIDLIELQKKLEQLKPWNEPQDKNQLVRELLQTSLPGFEKDLQRKQKILEGAPKPSAPPVPTAADRASFPAFRSWVARAEGVTMPEAELRQLYESTPSGGVGKPRDMGTASQAIYAGQQKYTDIRAPVLAIYAVPSDATHAADTEAQAKAFESGIPSARVVRLQHANHAVFLSNEADVLREMYAFLGNLP